MILCRTLFISHIQIIWSTLPVSLYIRYGAYRVAMATQWPARQFDRLLHLYGPCVLNVRASSNSRALRLSIDTDLGWKHGRSDQTGQEMNSKYPLGGMWSVLYLTEVHSGTYMSRVVCSICWVLLYISWTNTPQWDKSHNTAVELGRAYIAGVCSL